MGMWSTVAEMEQPKNLRMTHGMNNGVGKAWGGGGCWVEAAKGEKLGQL